MNWIRQLRPGSNSGDITLSMKFYINGALKVDGARFTIPYHIQEKLDPEGVLRCYHYNTFGYCSAGTTLRLEGHYVSGSFYSNESITVYLYRKVPKYTRPKICGHQDYVGNVESRKVILKTIFY